MADDFQFIRETRKEKPLNRKRVLQHILETVVLAVIFGAVGCLTFVLLKPRIEQYFMPEEKTQIFFIRKKAAPQKSFYTLEIKNHEIEQCHGRNNVDMTEGIRSFAYGFLKQLNTIKENPAVRAAA